MVELIVKRRRLHWAFAIQHHQRSEASRLIDVSAIAVISAFGDQAFALPQEFGGAAIDGFFDTPAEGIVLIGRGIAARQAGTNQTVLAVVTVFGDEFLPCATTFAGQVAVGVVVLVAVALHQQAVAFDLAGAGAVLHQQVAGRVVGEGFGQFVARMANPNQSVEGVVAVGALAVAAVGNVLEIAVGAVGIIAAVQRGAAMAYGVGK